MHQVMDGYETYHNSTLEKRTQNFINKSKEIHNDLYDLSKVKYTNNSSPVEIGCPIHDSFWQAPANHLKGQGCPECGKIKCGKNRRKTNDEFIKESLKIHNGKCTPIDDYTVNSTKIRFICNKDKSHPTFYATPANHLSGRGCPSCKFEKSRLGGYVSKDDDISEDICYLYTIRIYNDNEEFYKIGITNDINIRHYNIIMESMNIYNIDIVNVIIDTRRVCFLLEQKILKKKRLKGVTYIPKNKFGGSTECYTI